MECRIIRGERAQWSGGEPAKFNANMDEAFYSCALIHLANISYRLGRSLEFDPETLTFPRDKEATAC
jgi:hypothetical protein